jgi:hypothetical protein
VIPSSSRQVAAVRWTTERHSPLSSNFFES